MKILISIFLALITMLILPILLLLAVMTVELICSLIIFICELIRIFIFTLYGTIIKQLKRGEK